MSDKREQIQQEAKEAWLKSSRRNTIIVGTGGGKSKIAVDIVKTLQPTSILLLTNSENLRDKNWKIEFEKFGYPWDLIESECYQTACRWTNRKFDLVIADELDFALAPVFSQFFLYNKYKYLLGLTGFCSEEKREQLEQIAPVCFEVSTQQMQEEGSLNKSEFIIVNYTLSTVKNLEQKLKTGGKFFVSENDQYKYWDKQFQKAMMTKVGIEKKYRLLKKAFEGERDWQSADWRFKSTASKRKSLLNNLESSVKAVNEILLRIHAKKGNKVLVFSALTNQGARLGIPTYKGTDSDVALDKLNSGEYNSLAVCKKINRGTNMDGVNYIIKESFDGSETDFNQTHGRLMRLDVEQVAKYIILIPWYYDLVKTEDGGMVYKYLNTQAARWAEKMMQSFGDIKETKRIILDKNYKLPQGVEL